MSDSPTVPHTQAPDTAPAMSVDPFQALVSACAFDPPTRPGAIGSLGQIDIIKQLGEGGMGLVFLGEDTVQKRKVAVKMLKPDFARNTQAVRRFLKEARFMEQLSHPNILDIYEVKERAAGPYFVMPFMEQGSLAACMEPGKPMDERRALAIASDIASGIAYAHNMGIFHRDLKPANVLLDDAGRAYVADFGLGRSAYNDSMIDVQREQLEGTPGYIAPEIVAGHAGDSRVDIYSLGALIYEVLSGRVPYKGDSLVAVLAAVRAGPPPALKTLNPEIAPRVTQIVEQAMARELRDRYPSMGDLADDLNAVLDARSGGKARGVSASNRRWRVPLAIAGAVVLVGAAVVGYQFMGTPPSLADDPAAAVPSNNDAGQTSTRKTPDAVVGHTHQLKNRDGQLSLASGTLSGISPGAILVVRNPQGETALGYVRVVSATPLAAVVESVPYAQTAAVEPKQLPNEAVCEVVWPGWRDMRLAVNATGPKSIALLQQILQDHVKLVRLEQTNPQYILRDGERGVMLALPASEANVGVYDDKRGAGKLAEDLQRLAVVDNLWHVASIAGVGARSEADGLQLKVTRLSGDGELLGPVTDQPLPIGQKLKIAVHNNGDRDHWMLLLSVAGDCEVSTIERRILQARGKPYELEGAIQGEPVAGRRGGMIVLAVPYTSGRQQVPDVSWLEQPALSRYAETTTLAMRSRMSTSGPMLEMLRTIAGQHDPGLRGFYPSKPTQPVILYQSWLEAPAK